jgi:membrane protein DedA with SNARE-associated domain
VILASLSGSITHAIGAHSVYAVFVLMAIDAVFPVASELVMLYAGALATGAFSTTVTVFGIHVSNGAPSYVVVALAGTLGYLVGAIAGWWIGTRGGRTFVERHGHWIHLDSRRLSRAETWFQRWGIPGVLLGRLTPLVRSFVSIPAGVLEMPLPLYALLTLVGSAIWAFALAAIGWSLGARYAHFDHNFHYAEYAVVAIVASVFSLGALRVLRARRQGGASA